MQKLLIALFSLFIFSSCASGLFDKSVEQSTKIIKGFVKVHNTIQDRVDDTQQFCASTYLELADHKTAQKKLADFCDNMDKLFDEIQSIEEQFLTDSEE